MTYRVFISMLHGFLVAGCAYAVAFSSTERQSVPYRRNIGHAIGWVKGVISGKYKQGSYLLHRHYYNCL